MQTRLTWNDFLIQDISESNARDWLGFWHGTVKGKVAPVFMSKFGDWFLRLPDGSTDELSVIEGTYSTLASTPEKITGAKIRDLKAMVLNSWFWATFWQTEFRVTMLTSISLAMICLQ